VREAASAAIASGTELDALAPAQSIGQNRARHQLSKDVLRAVGRAAKTKRESDAAYGQAIRRGGRLGLSDRGIAAEAQVSHGTVRAILARTTTRANERHSQTLDEAPAAAGDIAR